MEVPAAVETMGLRQTMETAPRARETVAVLATVALPRQEAVEEARERSEAMAPAAATVVRGVPVRRPR